MADIIETTTSAARSVGDYLADNVHLLANSARAEDKEQCAAPPRSAGSGTDASFYSEDFGGAILNLTSDRHKITFVVASPALS